MNQPGQGRRPKASTIVERTRDHPLRLDRLPPAPARLDRDEQRAFKRVGRRLVALGMLTRSDLRAVEMFAVAWVRWVRAEREIKRIGSVVRGPDGVMPNPYCAVSKVAFAQWMSMLRELGLEPSASAARSATRRHDES